MSRPRAVRTVALACATLAALAGCTLPPPESTDSEAAHSTEAARPAATAPAPPMPKPDPKRVKTTASGLKYQDLVVGNGPSPKPGQTVTVQYTGWLTNGKKFDSSYDHGEPFKFPLGQGQVIAGWDEGVATMRAGGKRLLIVPPRLGYGDAGSDPIPPKSTLLFQVELIGAG